MAGSIYLFRHAEAGWGGLDCGDKARQLSDVGHHSSKAMGEWFKAKGYSVDVVLCSTAIRAKETMDGFLKAADLNPKIKFIENLYLAPPEIIIEALNEGNGSFKNIMIIGHNPGLHQVAFELAAGNMSQVDTELTTSYPPAGLTGFRNLSPKSPLKKENLNFLFFMHPRKI